MSLSQCVGGAASRSSRSYQFLDFTIARISELALFLTRSRARLSKLDDSAPRTAGFFRGGESRAVEDGIAALEIVWLLREFVSTYEFESSLI